MKFVPNKVTRVVARTVLKTQKQSPTVLFAAGVVGVVGTVVLASKATLRVEEVVSGHEYKMGKINSMLPSPKYTDKDILHDKTVVYTQTVMSLTKLYGPALCLGVVSVACLAGSNRILSKRNAALTAAYAGLEKAFREYRERVVDEVGVEREARIYTPTEFIEEIDENGKKVKVEKVLGKGGSPYAIVFDETNPNWNPVSDYNQFFLTAQQNYANDLLRARGHVFLNEIYEMLGVPHTKEGQIVGWVKNNPEGGDDYIDFGIFAEGNRFNGMRFVKGEERSVWLDFNVDGNVLDLI